MTMIPRSPASTRPALRSVRRPRRGSIRRLSLVTAFVAVAGLLAACGDDGAQESAAPEAGSVFPVTVEHKFGQTVVPSDPRRIAVIGLSEQDIVLALGKVPIATTEWYGEQPSAVWPWAQDKLGGAKPTVLSTADGFEFEKIAALNPDLIVGTNSGMKQADYTKLAAIAPTIPGVKGSADYFSPWEEQTVQVAKALGKETEGKALVDGIKADFAKVAAANPEFAGKTATFSQNAFYDGKIYVYPPGLNTEFLTMLGFTINPELTALAEVPGQQAAISAENLSKIDADVLVVAAEKPEDITNLEKVPTYTRLGAVSGKRTVYTDPILSGAMYFISPLSLPYVLEKLPPLLKAAVAGQAPNAIAAG
jgi:iron complex transport system substrate-binding protein